MLPLAREWDNCIQNSALRSYFNNYQHLTCMKNLIYSVIAIFSVMFFLSGCLTVEKKEYTFELTGDNSGRLTIRYINIMSSMDDGNDVSESDFEELINSYVEGNELEDEYPLATVVSKRLYEQNEQLCAEVMIDFPDLASVKLHQFDPASGYLYALCQGLHTESFVSTNGVFASEDVPVIMWPSKTKKLELVTLVTEPGETTLSLLPYFLKME